jgi:uncharacterized membrane protein
MEEFSQLFFITRTLIAQIVGTIGILVILVGTIKASFIYIRSFSHHEKISRIRIALTTHMILGLDFFIGKDIIDTFSFPSGKDALYNLAGLAIIIFLRIILNYSLLRELKEIEKSKE